MIVNLLPPTKIVLTLRDMVMDCSGVYAELVSSSLFRLGEQHQVSCLVLLFLSERDNSKNSLISVCERTFLPYRSTVSCGGTFFLSYWPIGICVRVGLTPVERLQWRSGDDRVPDRHPIATNIVKCLCNYSTDQKYSDSEGYGLGLFGSVCRSRIGFEVQECETISS